MSKSTHDNEEQQLARARNSLIDAKHPVPHIMSGVVDIKALSLEQRQGLLRGPQAQVFIGTKHIGYLQKRAVMALSPKANSFFRKNPLATDLRFGVNDMDEEATKTVLKYFSSPFLGAPTLRRILPGKNFIEAVHIYHAAVCFGLEAHVGHIKNSLHQAIGRDDLLLAYEELDILLTSVSVEDHLFKHVVAQYARLRYTGQIPDQDEFSQYVDARPAFAKAMADVDARHKAMRETAEESRARKQEQFLAWKAREKKREEWQARKLAAEKAAAARREEEAKARKAEKAAREPRPTVGLTRALKPEDYARLKRLFHSD